MFENKLHETVLLQTLGIQHYSVYIMCIGACVLYISCCSSSVQPFDVKKFLRAARKGDVNRMQSSLRSHDSDVNASSNVSTTHSSKHDTFV